MIANIKSECSDFIKSCGGFSLIKPLVCNGKYIRKVKVRKKNKVGNFIRCFDAAFEDEYRNIRGRSVICNTPEVSLGATEELFYIFPINGFKFLYNPSVDDSVGLEKNLETLDEDTFIDTIRYSYHTVKKSDLTLQDALQSGKEVIVYNIPYFYAFKRERFKSYYEVLNFLT